jgi:hypothetical protein
VYNLGKFFLQFLWRTDLTTCYSTKLI